MDAKLENKLIELLTPVIEHWLTKVVENEGSVIGWWSDTFAKDLAVIVVAVIKLNVKTSESLFR